MTETELESYRQVLQALRQRANGDIAHLADEALRTSGAEASGNLSHTPIHMADLGTDNFEQEFTLSLLMNEEHLVEEVEAALVRLKEGSFGRCEDCREPIAKVRLSAVPYTRWCIDCARKREQTGERG